MFVETVIKLMLSVSVVTEHRPADGPVGGFFFQLADHLREKGLGHAQLVGRLGDVLELRRHAEVLQIANFHVWSSRNQARQLSRSSGRRRALRAFLRVKYSRCCAD